ncbi:MAG TPA: deoxyribodipyrimidine photo-lyase [Methylotenera sp.]
MQQQTEVNIVWLKCDLRIQDYAALFEAAKNGPVLPIFAWDATVWSTVKKRLILT